MNLFYHNELELHRSSCIYSPLIITASDSNGMTILPPKTKPRAYTAFFMLARGWEKAGHCPQRATSTMERWQLLQVVMTDWHAKVPVPVVVKVLTMFTRGSLAKARLEVSCLVCREIMRCYRIRPISSAVEEWSISATRALSNFRLDGSTWHSHPYIPVLLARHILLVATCRKVEGRVAGSGDRGCYSG